MHSEDLINKMHCVQQHSPQFPNQSISLTLLDIHKSSQHPRQNSSTLSMITCLSYVRLPPLLSVSSSQGWAAPWRKEWPSPQPWPRVVSPTWSNGKTGACRRWERAASPRPASRPRSEKRSGGWRMMPTVTSATGRRRLVSQQVGSTHIEEDRHSTEAVNCHQQNYVLITSLSGIYASYSAN